MRRYEYYQRHKNSVDLYGFVLPDMLMSKEEVAELKIYLDAKQKGRKQYLEKINNIEFNDEFTCVNKEENALILKKTRKPNK